MTYYANDNEFPESLEILINQFRKLPGVGKKSAQRMALYCVKNPENSNLLDRALKDVNENIHSCEICGNITDGDICSICASYKRDKSTITVVEDVVNLLAIERSGVYFGLYHVLKGLISPMNDRGPDEIGIDSLLHRIDQMEAEGSAVKEVILAISPTIEGETTMLFLADILNKRGIDVSRIASGIPVGGSLEYYDELTLMKALEDRREIGGKL